MQTGIEEQLSRVVDIAVQAAAEAGDYFRSRIDSIGEIKTKSSPSDLVTDVDPECERLIRERIFSVFPNHDILGEETTAPGSEASRTATEAIHTAKNLWIIDPLDGTTNFVHGLPLSVVSIAYASDGVIQVGVVYDPYRLEMFCAVRGQGAFQLKKPGPTGRWTFSKEIPLSVSNPPSLRHSIVATGVPTRGEARAFTTEAALRLVGHIKSFRILGAAALHMAYVAAGRIDAFWEYDLNAWDLAAGSLLVQEAGGKVIDIQGGEYRLTTRDVAVSGLDEAIEGILSAVRIPKD